MGSLLRIFLITWALFLPWDAWILEAEVHVWIKIKITYIVHFLGEVSYTCLTQMAVPRVSSSL